MHPTGPDQFISGLDLHFQGHLAVQVLNVIQSGSCNATDELGVTRVRPRGCTRLYGALVNDWNHVWHCM